ncbi:glycosyltransferase [Fulvivirga sedimenti]|uniref:Glycosyltransferase n=1 Tax=Fulvivirga sedimenti TaxID=2879465 RepID=A0A9X1HXB2_9BACT|nr:glycosyltransferase [Fulvivirga sedimenti]MCA6078758.1 glycosyltransferase [Fulvivirga sedimenti]
MSLSVILPVHDNRETLPLAVESILHQTFTDFELLIICNGSPVPVQKFVQSLKDPRIRPFFLPAAGLSRALNFGIKLSTGRYIARMDADDICSADRLLKQADFLNANPATGVVSSLISHDGDSEGFARFVRWQNSLQTHEEMFMARYRDAVICHPSVMFRRSIFSTHGGYSEDPIIPEDFELWLRWFEQGVHFSKIPEKLFTWRDNSVRLSRSHPAYSDQAFLQVKIEYLRKHLSKESIRERPILVLGNSRMINQKISEMNRHGIRIHKKVDVKLRPGNDDVITYDQIKHVKNPFLISLVRDYNGRKRISNFLKSEGFKPETDYLMLE